MKQTIEKIWTQVAAITGYEFDGLEDDLLLDVDLGIDSLKTMSLWNSVLSVLDEAAQARGRESQAEMMAVRTLGELTNFVVGLTDNSSDEPRQISAKTYVSDVDPGGEILPMAHAQRLFLLSHQLVNSTSLCSMVRVSGALNITLLQQAWQYLIDTEVNLRTCFYIPPSCKSMHDIEYRFLDVCRAPVLNVYKSSSDDIEKIFFENLNRKWDIRQWPLHEFSIHEVARDDYLIVLANEHIISDGLGNQRMLRSLLESYEKLQRGTGLSISDAQGVNHYREQVEAINGYRDEDEVTTFRQYNQNLGKETCIWNPNGSIGDSRENYFRNRTFALSVATTDALQRSAREHRYPLYSVLLGLWLRTLSAHLPEKEKFILQLPTSGIVYPGCELDKTIGCWAQNMALEFNSARDTQTLASVIDNVNENLQHAIASGFDRAQTCLMADAYAQDFPMPNGIIPEFALLQAQKSMRSNLYFPYTGQTNIRKKYGTIEITDYRAGTCNVAGTIDVLQEIHQGQLVLFANYDALHFNERQIDTLVEDYLSRLKDFTHPFSSETAQNLTLTTTTSIQDFVITQAQAVLSVEVGEEHLPDDLEYDLGVDSLERIRLVTQIAKSLGKNTLSKDLLRKRSLQEFVDLLVAKGEAVNTKQEIDMACVNESSRKIPATLTEGYSQLDQNLAQIPLRHIEKQASLTPLVEAVCNQQDSITYEQLDSRANQVARLLVSQGVVRGDRVAMLCNRGPNMLVAIIGILKAGAAYVPLDPGFPNERIEYIINHARARCLVGENNLLAEKAAAITLPDTLQTIVDLTLTLEINRRPILTSEIDYFTGTELQQISTEMVWVDIDPGDLMVVLYTSGSTGKPKGVALNHEGYYNRLNWHQNAFQLRAGERVAQKTSCCFDVSVWELLWPLMAGGTVCAVEKDVVTNPWALLDWINNERISVMHFVPSMFNEFVHALGEGKQDFSALRWLIFSGEALAVATIKQWIDSQGMGVQLANLYGPTEASIDVTCHVIPRRPAEDQLRIPIGAPIDNTLMLILDSNGQLITEPDVVGELYIAGIQLAQGYLFDEEKTAAAFINNPFSAIPGEKIYRTGDVACWMENGEIDYRGRIDSQVKLRGFRIELGEIEAVLTEHCNAEEAAALVVEVNGQKKLMACYSPPSLPIQSLKILSAKKLTEYMVPQIWIGLDRLPKNPNGKLDRNQLLAMFNAGEIKANPIANADAKLNVVKELATGSIKMENPPLIKLPAVLASENGSLGLTPAQLGILQSNAALYQRATVTRLQYHGKLDVDAFCAALQALVKRHDVLRSRFICRDNIWQREEVADPQAYVPLFFDARSCSPEQINVGIGQLIKNCADSLQLTQWPLMKVILVKCADEITEVVIVSHQIIGDMVSGNLMCQQLWQAYDILVRGGQPDIKSIPSGKDLANSLLEAECQEGREILVNYWINELPKKPWPFHLPQRNTFGSNTYDSQKGYEAFLNKDESHQILQVLTRNLRVSPYAVFAGPLYKLMGSLASNPDVVISHRFNGRNPLGNRVYFDSVDGFALNFPLALNMNQYESSEKLAKAFEKKLASVPWRGASYDWVGMDLPVRCYPEGNATRVRMNFLGDISAPENNKIRIVASDISQRLIDQHLQRSIDLEVWIKIVNGKIGIEIGYSSYQFDSGFIKKIVFDYFAEVHMMLENINSLTIDKENGYVAA